MRMTQCGSLLLAPTSKLGLKDLLNDLLTNLFVLFEYSPSGSPTRTLAFPVLVRCSWYVKPGRESRHKCPKYTTTNDHRHRCRRRKVSPEGGEFWCIWVGEHLLKQRQVGIDPIPLVSAVSSTAR